MGQGDPGVLVNSVNLASLPAVPAVLECPLGMRTVESIDCSSSGPAVPLLGAFPFLQLTLGLKLAMTTKPIKGS